MNMKELNRQVLEQEYHENHTFVSYKIIDLIDRWYTSLHKDTFMDLKILKDHLN